MVSNLPNLWHLFILTKTCVLRQKIMKPKVSIIGIFVQRVGKWMVKCIRIRRWIAEHQRQKTNKAGHVENSSSCPENPGFYF